MQRLPLHLAAEQEEKGFIERSSAFLKVYLMV
jgi:hypothetical protein